MSFFFYFSPFYLTFSSLLHFLPSMIISSLCTQRRTKQDEYRVFLLFSELVRATKSIDSQILAGSAQEAAQALCLLRHPPTTRSNLPSLPLSFLPSLPLAIDTIWKLLHTRFLLFDVLVLNQEREFFLFSFSFRVEPYQFVWPGSSQWSPSIQVFSTRLCICCNTIFTIKPVKPRTQWKKI